GLGSQGRRRHVESCRPGARDPVHDRGTCREREPLKDMQLAAEILLALVMLVSVVVVLAVFVWGAKKDGEDDQAVQRRLGIRRKTRLGPSLPTSLTGGARDGPVHRQT